LVFQEHGTQVAMVTAEDRVHLQPITVNKLMDQFVEVGEGLSAKDRIINNPSAALLEGDPVRIVTPAPGYDLVNTTSSSAVPHTPSPNGPATQEQAPQVPQATSVSP
jgi:hypothetical protein